MAEKISRDAPTKKVDLQVDTLSYTPDAAAYFSPHINTITQNYVIGRDNTFNQSRSTLAHEEKHRNNNAQGLKNMPMSLEEYYKVCCHDEISATICELLQLRQEYIDAKTPEEREKIVHSSSGYKFGYYFDAVKKGEINPLSNSPEDFQKEMKFIATKTQEMWMKNHAVNYNDNHVSMTKNFLKVHDSSKLKPNPENYNKALKIAYTIGGIDFSKYMKDIPCINPSIELADEMIANNRHKTNIEGAMDKENINFNNRYDILLSDMQMNFEQRLSLSEDIHTADMLKEILRVKKQFNEAKTKEEKNNIKTENWYAQNYLENLKNKKFENKKFPLGQDEIDFINGFIYSHVEGNSFIYNKVKEHYANNPDNFKRNDKNYQAERSKIFTIDGFDYSPYIYSVAPNRELANFIEADRLIEKESPDYKIEAELRIPDKNDIISINYEQNQELSVMQQYQLARHKMFVQNAIITMNQGDINLTKEGSGDFLSMAMNSYKDILSSNPTLHEQWQKQEQELAKAISKEYGILPLPQNNEEQYQKELAKIYTYNGIDIQKYTDINTLLPQTEIPQVLTELEKSTWYERGWSKFKDTVLGDKQSIGGHLSAYAPEKKYKKYHYTGTPKYPQWSPEKRVSEVQPAEIYDFTQPFLKNQYEQMRINDVEKHCEVSAAFSESKMDKVLKNKPTENDKKEINKIIERENYQQPDATQTTYNKNLVSTIQFAKLNKVQK